MGSCYDRSGASRGATSLQLAAEANSASLIPGLVTRDPRFAKPLSLSLSCLFLGLKFLDRLTVCEEFGLDAVECGFGLLPGLAVGHETSLGFGL